jgi:uncharacterized protein YkwD
MTYRTGLCVSLSVSLAVLVSSAARAEPDPGFEQALIAAVNQVRAQNHLPPVRIDRRLTAAASGYARELAERRVLEHAGRDGEHVNARVDRVGYVWGFVGENLAGGARDVRETVTMWMERPGHRANLLSRDAVDAGAAREITTDPGNPYHTYDVLVLARPRR